MGKNKRKRHEESNEPVDEVGCSQQTRDNELVDGLGCSQQTRDNNAEDVESHSYRKKKKKDKSKSKHDNAIDITQECSTIISEEAVDNVPKKRHKKKHGLNLDESAEFNFEPSQTCSVDVNPTPSSDISKKKKKKKKSKERKDKPDETDQNLNDSMEHAAGKKSKKSKHTNILETTESSFESKQELSEIAMDEVVNDNKSNTHKHKKKKKHKEKDSSVDNDLNQDFKKYDVGINKQTVVSEDSNSLETDSFTTDPKTDKEKNIENKSTIGQWGSAEFENTDRQNKFYRLLGGMKNTNSSNLLQKKIQLGSAAAGPSSKSGGSGAMNRHEQSKYTRTLEANFEKALNSNSKRGIGLGFEKPPDEGKKFFIDTRKSNSIKFDD